MESVLSYLLIATAATACAGFIISGIDDLLIDIIYWVSRPFTRDSRRPIRLSILNDKDEMRAAILIAAWQESSVLEEMIDENVGRIDYRSYEIFIGCYENDPETQAVVDRLHKRHPNVNKVVNPKRGPTTKSDNLNVILDYVEHVEERSGLEFGFFVLHDAEDVMHPFELKLANYHMQRGTADMIQMPIYAVRESYGEHTAATYMDQFAEVHTKDLEVRRLLQGFIPSGGVGTTLSRGVLSRLSEETGEPFDTRSFTEDYEIGRRVSLAGMQSTFIRQKVTIDEDARSPDGPAEMDAEPYVVTRGSFPHDFAQAVRQRARWMLGIVFQSWKHTGWKAAGVDHWLLFHDRKTFWSYSCVALGYALLFFLIAYMLVRTLLVPSLAPGLIPTTGWLWWMILVSTGLMANRLLQRAIAVARVYDLRHGVLAIIRQPWDNLINIAALYRAGRQFFKSEMYDHNLKWDKTEHHSRNLPTNGQEEPADHESDHASTGVH